MKGDTELLILCQRVFPCVNFVVCMFRQGLYSNICSYAAEILVTELKVILLNITLSRETKYTFFTSKHFISVTS